MRRILLVVEGATERAFLEKLLGEQFAHRGLAVSARIVGKPGHKGGRLALDRVLDDIVRLLKQESQSIITTCFDYYGLPWEFANSVKPRPAHLAVVEIENELARRVVGRIPSTCNSKRFVPYIQLHELEAVFFADPDAVAGAFDQPGIADRLRRIVLECDGCETINDRFETKPSQRLQNLFPNYRKGASAQAHAPLIADRMSLETARKKCPHFSEWLTKLEAFRTV